MSLSDLDEILGTIIRILPILVGVERAALYQWDAEKDVFHPSQQYGLGEDDERTFWNRSFAPGEFAFLDSCRGATGLMACQLDEQTDRGPPAWLSLDPNQEVNLANPGVFLFAVPIAVKDDLYGVMLIEEAQGGLRFRARRIEIINGIAQQAALAIQNDLLQQEMVVRERLETEVQLARQIQQTFIPRSLPQFRIGSWPRAGRRLARWAAISMMYLTCRTSGSGSSLRMWPIKAFLPPSSWRSHGPSSGLPLPNWNHLPQQ